MSMAEVAADFSLTSVYRGMRRSDLLLSGIRRFVIYESGLRDRAEKSNLIYSRRSTRESKLVILDIHSMLNFCIRSFNLDS